ncbi:MAG: hypothetical protein B7X55_13150 [Rhodobacterales bacterium 34-62-10]|nr:MAG: hypothetical protein B7X55_13150 [Rhodobacterales bacterium 34-62-10]
MGYLGRHPEAVTLDDLAVQRAAATAAKFPGVPLERWRQEVTHTHVETPEGVRINYDPGLREAVIAAGAKGAPDLWPLFDALSPLPCAVIHGVNSDLLSHATVARMAERMPGLIVAHVPDRAHIPFLDEAEALAALGQWLEQMA